MKNEAKTRFGGVDGYSGKPVISEQPITIIVRKIVSLALRPAVEMDKRVEKIIRKAGK